jgi:hypothetical protein
MSMPWVQATGEGAIDKDRRGAFDRLRHCHCPTFMDMHVNLRMAFALAHRAGHDARPRQIADVIGSVLDEIEAVLSPILGPRAVAALYQRSVYLSSTGLPWLADKQEGSLHALDIDALKAALGKQSSPLAATGGSLLLATLVHLLASLIGHSLTESLLRSVWQPTSNSPETQDFAP